MAARLKIPFDSLNLAAVLCEIQPYLGGKLQKVVQPGPFSIHLTFYAGGKEATLMLSCDPQFARMHFVTKRAGGIQPIPQFCSLLRSRLDGARLRAADQVGFDRIAHLLFEGPLGGHRLIAELMGKHSNLILLDQDETVVGAAKWVSRAKSKRPVQPGRRYVPPPFEPKPSLLSAIENEPLANLEGASPFLLRLLESQGDGALARVKNAVRRCDFQPVLSPGVGAYPMSVAALGLEEHARSSISLALEQHFDQAIRASAAETLRQSTLSQLNRVLLAREVAAEDLLQALDTATRASDLQRQGEILLAHAHTIPADATEFRTENYEGDPVLIRLNPDLSALENAERLFKKARQAKSRGPFVKEQLGRVQADLTEVKSLIAQMEAESRLESLQNMQELARRKKWLIDRPPQTNRKEDRPFEGHRIREALGPGGSTVLYGENAEANDYLLVRVAKPNDYWLHVRGSQSAHAIIPTHNHPERIARDALEFAARIVVQNSPSKHSGYVPVDYTLRKYVRKPKGAAKGMAIYTHEKTLHIESKPGQLHS